MNQTMKQMAQRCLVVILSLAATHGLAEAPVAVTRQVRYGFVVENTRGAVLEDGTLWVVAPAGKTPFQICRKLTATQDFRVQIDQDGNRILVFSLEGLPPFATRVISIHAEVELRDQPRERMPPSAACLAPEPLMAFDDDSFRALAPALPSGDADEQATALFDWVRDHVADAGYKKRPLGALAALKNAKGDCTEYSTLFVALCRSHDIPARVIGGYVMDNSGVLRPSGYHEWAEYYDGSTWRLADPQQGRRAEGASRYLALRTGVSTAGVMQGHPRFRFEGDGLRVTMSH